MPTLRELEAVCQKPNWQDVGSLLARRFARPVAIYVTWLVVRWPVSANVVTTVALIVGGAAAVFLGVQSVPGFIAGAALLQLWYLLDHVDGQVARFRHSESVTGVYFDFMMHHMVHPACAFALGYGIASRTGDLPWTLAGAAFALGVMAQALSNDCRYKAFFAVLPNGEGRDEEVRNAERGMRNAEGEVENVEGEGPEGLSGGEYPIDAGTRGPSTKAQYSVLSTQYPVLSTQYSVLGTQYSVHGTQYSAFAIPPASSPSDYSPSLDQSNPPQSTLHAPRSVLSIPHSALRTPHSALRTSSLRLALFMLRLLQKTCEMPNVVLAITALAVVVAIDSAVGLRATQWYVLAMSVLAPGLGMARLAKQVWCRLPDAEVQKFACDRDLLER